MALVVCCSTAFADVPRVSTVALESVLDFPTYSAPATVVPRDAPDIAAEVSARIVEIPVVVGDTVSVGSVIAQLDCARLEARRDASEASLARAQTNRQFAARQLRRAEDLSRKKSISEELLDQRRTELASSETDALSAEAALVQANIDVDSCVLRSPLSGVVTARHASVGDYVTPGSPVIALTATVGQDVSIALRADQIAGFEDAGKWTFVHNGDAHQLRLRTILPVLDSIGRTREARLTFDGTAAMPGTPGRVAWQDQSQQIPSDFLLRRNGQIGVFVLEGSEARFFPLPGAQEGRPAVTTLPPDTRLIKDGRQRLSDGDAVQVIDDVDGPR